MGICPKVGTDCIDLLSAVGGPNCCLDFTTLGDLIILGLQSSSTNNMIHLTQMIEEGTITMYDYGDENENKKHNGQPTPPVYNMASVPNDFCLFLSHGGKDVLSDVTDVKLLLHNLKSHIRNKLDVKYIDKYAHLHFIFGINAKKVVYDPLIAFSKRH